MIPDFRTSELLHLYNLFFTFPNYLMKSCLAVGKGNEIEIEIGTRDF